MELIFFQHIWQQDSFAAIKFNWTSKTLDHWKTFLSWVKFILFNSIKNTWIRNLKWRVKLSSNI